MISQQELPAFIEKNMPEFSGITDIAAPRTIYTTVRHLLTYTVAQVAKHNMQAAKQCLALVAQLHKKGNRAIKNAIENVYVFSFSHAFFSNDHTRKEILDILPTDLYEIYRSQLLNSHL